jgi:hypothetical protein
MLGNRGVPENFSSAALKSQLFRIQYRCPPGLEVLSRFVGEFSQFVGVLERGCRPPVIGLDLRKHETGDCVLLFFRQGSQRLNGLFHQSGHGVQLSRAVWKDDTAKYDGVIDPPAARLIDSAAHQADQVP